MEEAAGLRLEMVRIGRLLYERQLIVAAEGNLSARLGGDSFLVTPAGLCKGFLAPEHPVVVNLDGRPAPGETGRPTSEWPLHREVYLARPDVAAVCHAHPPWATAFAAARQPLTGCLLPEAVLTLGAVPLAAYATPGTEEVARSVRDLVAAGHDAFLLANHGAVTLGGDLTEAFHRLETVERLAQVTLLARLAGGERRLGPRDVQALQAAGERAAAVARCEPAGSDPLTAGAGGDRPLAGPDLDLVAEALAARILAEIRRLR